MRLPSQPKDQITRSRIPSDGVTLRVTCPVRLTRHPTKHLRNLPPRARTLLSVFTSLRSQSAQPHATLPVCVAELLGLVRSRDTPDNMLAR